MMMTICAATTAAGGHKIYAINEICEIMGVSTSTLCACLEQRTAQVKQE
jgi:predicted transcriptional regulator of viral defense system